MTVFTTPTDHGDGNQTDVGGSTDTTIPTATFNPIARGSMIVGVRGIIQSGTNPDGTITDDATGTSAWSEDASYQYTNPLDGSFRHYVGIWRATVGASPGTGRTVTWTRTPTGNIVQIWAVSVLGTVEEAYLLQVASGVNDSTDPFAAAPSFSTTPATDSLVVGVAYADNGTVTQPTGWTEIAEYTDTGPGTQRLEMAYKNGAAVQSPSWAKTTGAGHIAALAVEYAAYGTTPGPIIVAHRAAQHASRW